MSPPPGYRGESRVEDAETRATRKIGLSFIFIFLLLLQPHQEFKGLNKTNAQCLWSPVYSILWTRGSALSRMTNRVPAASETTGLCGVLKLNFSFKYSTVPLGPGRTRTPSLFEIQFSICQFWALH